MTFQHFPKTNKWGCKFWPWRLKVKRQPTTIFWTNLVNLESPMLHTKIQSQNFLGSGEENFKCFTIYVHGSHHVFNGAEPFEEIVNTLSTKGPMWNLVKIAQAISEKKTFKNNIILYMYIAKRQEQINTRIQNFNWN